MKMVVWQNIITKKDMILSMPKMPNRMFLTGCDEKTEWQLPWFLDNYWRHNKYIPIAIANFGMSESMANWIQDRRDKIFCVMNLNPDEKLKGWFLKPAALISAPAVSTVWIDTDCEILSPLGHVFSLLQPNKLNMVVDRPWLKRRQEEWHNSGVVGIINKPEILHLWNKAVKANPKVGDQEVLHDMLNPITKMTYINELPNEYNWLRLQVEHDDEDSPNKKIMHWTGEKGNDRIRAKMKVKEVMNA